jgi:hypothetical protein
MHHLMQILFRRPSVAQIETQAREEAKLSLAQHRQAHEYHEAMIGMYERRIARLTAVDKVAA